MSDQNFPLIEYVLNDSPKQRGQKHGENFREGISELIEIRRKLMLAKSPHLEPHLNSLALEQWNHTKNFSPSISEELAGICEGSNSSIEDIVILNNYTDFRDIELPEEGCSVLHAQHEGNVFCGQTWDMHQSAKKYVCTIQLPTEKETPGAIIFSLVGCVGMMGYNTSNILVGVNNINTRNAKTGILWPALVRQLLTYNTLDEVITNLKAAPVTSGHNYILSSKERGENWEVTPNSAECVSKTINGQDGVIFHTNHCLGPETIKVEDKNSISSTTHKRYELLEELCKNITSLDDITSILKDHTNYPKSICSHFENGAQDPSSTCGGGTADFTNDQYKLWRGCKEYDKNFVEYLFELIETNGVRNFVRK